MPKFSVRIEWTMDAVYDVEADSPAQAAELARAIPIDYEESNNLGMNIAEVYDDSNGEMVLEI